MVADGFCDLLPEYPQDDASQRPDRGFVYANERTFAYATAFVIRRGDPGRFDGIESIEGRRIATGPGWDYSAMSVDYQGYIDDSENANWVEVVAGIPKWWRLRICRLRSLSRELTMPVDELAQNTSICSNWRTTAVPKYVIEAPIRGRTA